MQREEMQTHRFSWRRWIFFSLFLLAIVIIASLFLFPKPLNIKGSLITLKGPLAAGKYDFRLKFYSATTRIDLAYSYDVKDVAVDAKGNFETSVPIGNALKGATLMQVCIDSSQVGAPESIIKESPTLLSCEVTKTGDTSTAATYDQTICGLTAVNQKPASLFNWLTAQNTVYATPTKSCGPTNGQTVASVSDKDVVTPLLRAPGSLTDVLGGADLQPGTVITIGADGQVVGVPPAEVVEDIVQEEIAKNEAQNPSGPLTNVFNSYPTIIEGEPNTDSQTLTLSGNALSISGGNSVTLPGGDAEEDGIVGNEITDVISGGGLVRVGAGTTLDPFSVGIVTCANGEVLKSDGSGWACGPDAGGASYSAGNGLQLIGAQFSVNSPTCAGTTKLQWTGTAFVCSTDVDTDTNTTYSAGTGLSLVGTTFNNTGTLSVAGSGAITSTGGQTPTIAFANGSVTGQFWQWDGDSWELATLAAEQDSVIGNEVTGVTGAASGLTRSGAGTAVSPYTLAANVGNGIQITSNAIAVNSPTCSGTDKLQWTGTAFVCSADVDTDTNTTYSAGNGLQLAGTTFSVNSPTCAGTTKLQWTGTAFVCSADVDTNTDAQTLSWVDGTRTLSISGGNSVVIPDADTNTTYSALANGGLRLVGTEFGLAVCATDQILKAQATSGEWACAADADTNTTYSAGTGLSLVGTTFNNTGVLDVTGSGAITSTGGQNPNIAFADGAVSGQFWQWDGDSWELATLAAEQDAVIGNEVTNVTGANSGLVRSGAGTAVDPYTLAVSVGNGLQLSSGSVAINSPTCAGTTKLQWTGTAFVCSADVDTDTNTTYTADGQGIELASTVFSLELNGTSLAKSASGLSLNLSNANTWAALQTFGAGATVTAGQTLTVNGDAFTDLTGTGLTISGGALQTTLGTSIDLATEVNGILPVANGGTALNAVGAANQLLGTNAAGTALEYKDLSSLLVAGSGISLSGTSTVTITNTGAAATCVVTSNYACNGGNTLAAALTLGTNDANSLIFETNNATAMTILSDGNVGIGVSPTEKLDVNGNINIPVTTASVGIIKQAGARFIHSFGGVTNFFAGTNAGNFTLTGLSNTGVGADTLKNLTTGSGNNALGISALEGVTTGSNNTGMGSFALQDNTIGGNNSALGWGGLANTLDGNNNSAFGANALQNNVSGSFNVGMGAQALQVNTAGANTAIGNAALLSNTSGEGNVALGYAAGVTEVPANANTIGSNNTFIGLNAGLGSATQLNHSSAIGAHAVVSQNDSLVLGCITGANGCTARTRVGVSNTAPGFLLHVGDAAVTSGTSVARFQNAGGTCTVTPNTAGGITCTSDARLKKNIEDFSDGIDIVNKIDIKKFNMLADAEGTPQQIGVIAQQLETVLPGLVQTDKDGYKSVSYAALAPIMLQAVKEQQVELNKLKGNVLSGGIVTKDTVFKAAAVFRGPVRFTGSATFAGDVTISGKLKLSGDQANQVVLPAGQHSVAISFRGVYPQKPRVTATPGQFIIGAYRITNVTTKGFIIEVQQTQSEDIHFDWLAFMNSK